MITFNVRTVNLCWNCEKPSSVSTRMNAAELSESLAEGYMVKWTCPCGSMNNSYATTFVYVCDSPMTEFN